MKYIISLIGLLTSLCYGQTYPQNTNVTFTNYQELHSQLVHDIWGDCGFPTGASTISSIGTYNGFTYSILTSGARYFNLGSNKLLIFHAGHSQQALDEAVGGPLIRYAISLGWDILALEMPPSPHNVYAALEHPLASPFMTPIALSLNYITQYKNYDTIVMAGLSGGGWATVLYSAIDERIQKSYPIAGSWPFYLRYASGNPSSIGDFEQQLPGLHVNYFDLYTLALTNARTQIQFFNSDDPCCFGGDVALDYLNRMQANSGLFGGTFDIIIEQNNQHSIPIATFPIIAGMPPPSTNKVAHWKLDESLNSIVMVDADGNYNGIYQNNPILESVSLTNSGTSLTTDGISDFALVPDYEALRPGTQEYSIEMWVKYSGITRGMAFGKFDNTGPYYPGPTVFFNIKENTQVAGYVEFRDKRLTSYWVDSSIGNLNDGIARYYVFQRRKVGDVWQLEMYINGILNNYTILPTVEDLNNTNPIFLFSRPEVPQNIQGTFDDIYYHVGEVLTPTQVNQNYLDRKR